MRAIAAGLTDIGRERSHNEDRFILLPEFHVFVVADGMGGHQSGEVASRMAAATIASYFRQLPGTTGDGAGPLLKAAVCDANSKIFSRADDSRAHRGMGTTVVASVYSRSENIMHVCHAGDSRAYHLRGGKMVQLTRDHSLLSDALLERPELTEADLAYLPRNVITRALGIGPTVEVDANSCEAQPGDVFLLCSDGLHGLVEDDDIMAIIDQYPSLTEACQRLVDAANANGGKDNITAVLVRIEEDDEPWSSRSPKVDSASVGTASVQRAAASPQAASAPASAASPASSAASSEASAGAAEEKSTTAGGSADGNGASVDATVTDATVTDGSGTDGSASAEAPPPKPATKKKKKKPSAS